MVLVGPARPPQSSRKGPGARRGGEESGAPVKEGRAGPRHKGDRFIGVDIGAANRDEACSVASGLAMRVSWIRGSRSTPTAASCPAASTTVVGAFVGGRRGATPVGRGRAPNTLRCSSRRVDPRGDRLDREAVPAPARWASSPTWRSWVGRHPRDRLSGRGADKKQSGDHKLGGGVVLSRGSSVSSVVFDRWVECAPRARRSRSRSGGAARKPAPTRTRSTTRCAAFTPAARERVPNRYMHSPNEMVALEDLDRAADLLAAFRAAGLGAGVGFYPEIVQEFRGRCTASQ